MHVLYITKMLPFGEAETFIFSELEQHSAAGWRISICPVERGPLLHESGRKLLPNTFAEPLFSATILIGFARALISRPVATLGAVSDVFRSRPRLIPRNLAVLAKAAWLAGVARKQKVDHIHAHWIAVPATMAMIAARISGVPFSITAHRYDIAQNNLIPLKLGRAKFVRAIDQRGAEELADAAPEVSKKPLILYMGTELASDIVTPRLGNLPELKIICAARLIEKKGHIYLLRAIAKARQQGLEVFATLCGPGPLRELLEAAAHELEIDDLIVWRGLVSHDALLEELRRGNYDAAVLPSVVATDGDREGIPVFVMEAMSCGLPTITTPNGGLTELTGDDCGLVVPERDPSSLAQALLRLASSQELRTKLSINGRRRIEEAFEAKACATKLRHLISSDQEIAS